MDRVLQKNSKKHSTATAAHVEQLTVEYTKMIQFVTTLSHNRKIILT